MKKSINRENYEVWLIDYIDNNLNTSERKEVEHFLASNPDIREELDDLEMLPADDVIVFEDKRLLKKELKDVVPQGISSLNDFMIANLEGDLDLNQQRRFDALIKSEKVLEKEYAYFLQTKSNPDPTIVFPYKSNLKKGVIYRLPSLINQYSALFSIAAILLVLVIMVDISSIKQSFLNSNGFSKVYNNNIQELQNRPNWSFNTEMKTVINKSDLINNQLASVKVSSKKENNGDFGSPEIVLIKPVKQSELPNTNQNRNNNVDNEPETSFNKIRIEKVNSPTLAMTNSTSTPINKYLSKQFREKALNEEVDGNDNRKLSIWDVADAGLQRIGKLFNKDINLNKEYDEHGEVVSLAYNSPNLGFTAPLRKSKP